MVPSIKGKKLNKGEWAEFYVMMKLLGEGKLYTANKLLQKNYENYLEVLKVIRQEYDVRVLEYIVNDEDTLITIKEQDKDNILAEIPTEYFRENAKILFDGIKNIKASSVVAPDEVSDFARVIYVSKPKAPAVQALKAQFGGKNDIFIEVRDSQTSIVSVMGFSIKSKFADNPTLFNAGSTSQYLYKLDGCTAEKMQEFNDIKSNGNRAWIQCEQYLIENQIGLSFIGTEHTTYSNNLFLIRESMADIMAWCVKERLTNKPESYNVKEIVEKMTAENPLRVPNPAVYYEKAVKDFLIAGFTGMTAGKIWDGKEQVNGGYIVVMDDGDVICYHSNDRESFRDYLYRNTFFEYVSTKKFKWSYIREENGEYYLPLNISVRFSKKTR